MPSVVPPMVVTFGRRLAAIAPISAALVMLILIGGIVFLASRLGTGEEVWQATWKNGLLRAALLGLVVAICVGWLKAIGRRRLLLGGGLLLLLLLSMPAMGLSPPLVSPSIASLRTLLRLVVLGNSE